MVHGGWLDMAARRLRPPPAELKAVWDQVERVEPFEVLAPLGKK